MSISRAEGFSLIEVLVALFLLQMALLALAPMFIYATKATASAADMGDVGAIASQRMELLRGVPFAGLTAGGSLTSNVSGFSDNSNPDFAVRWSVTDDATPPTIKTILVRVVARREVLGLPKEVTLASMAAQEQ